VNPDLAPVVAGSLADEREQNYRDAMLGIQERGQATREKAQGAQETQFASSLAQRGSQFGENLAFEKQSMADQIDAANRARTMGYVNLGLGSALGAGYLATAKPANYYDPNNPNGYFKGRR
jgi:hypothetical protein